LHAGEASKNGREFFGGRRKGAAKGLTTIHLDNGAFLSII
jgi:hypothetical protein